MAKKLTVGIDVGGTKISAGLVSPQGKVLKMTKIATGTGGGRTAILANIEKCIAEIWSPGVSAIGIGMAGIVDHKKGVYLEGPNFPRPFRNVPIGRLLKKHFGVPAVVDNDVHCFTLAEATYGAAKGKKSVVGVTLGTGIGGGIVLNGEIYRGKNNAAGELGHMTISGDEQAVCGCGRIGHFEAFSSGTAMVNLYTRMSGERRDAFAIERAAKDGDKRARAVIDVAATALATGIANIIHFLDPDIITVGGGIVRVHAIWKPMQIKLKSLLIYPALRTTPVVQAALGDGANVIGAAILTKKR